MNKSLQFVTDEKGKRTAVVMSIVDYEELLDDLDDLAAIAERRNEPTLTHEELTAELRADGLLSD